MDNKEIRMRIVEAVIPQATRVGLTDAKIISSACEKLEDYVINGVKVEKPEAVEPPATKKTSRAKKAK